MTEEQKTPAPTVWHSLSYKDAPAAIAFLTEAFGFRATAVYHSDDQSRVVHAQLDWPPGGGVMLGSSESGRHAGEDWVDSSGQGQCYCVTETDEDVDRIYAAAMAGGATSVREPVDQPYGGRGCTVRDPEGNQWSFGSYRGEPS